MKKPLNDGSLIVFNRSQSYFGLELGNVFAAFVAYVSSFQFSLTYSLTHCPIFEAHRHEHILRNIFIIEDIVYLGKQKNACYFIIHKNIILTRNHNFLIAAASGH
jgi:hypothetical protein